MPCAGWSTPVTAEEMGITKANVDVKLQEATSDPSKTALRRFLGVDGELGSKLGLRNDFVVSVLKTTGNYGEIYDRHLGPQSAVPIPRGLNQLHRDGGVLIAPPFQ